MAACAASLRCQSALPACAASLCCQSALPACAASLCCQPVLPACAASLRCQSELMARYEPRRCVGPRLVPPLRPKSGLCRLGSPIYSPLVVWLPPESDGFAGPWRKTCGTESPCQIRRVESMCMHASHARLGIPTERDLGTLTDSVSVPVAVIFLLSTSRAARRICHSGETSNAAAVTRGVVLPPLRSCGWGISTSEPSSVAEE